MTLISIVVFFFFFQLSKSSPVEPSPIKSSSGIASGLAPISVKGPISQTPLSVSTPPRPLLPPPGLQMQSFRQQIPRLATATNGQHTPKNSFEKLLQRLITTFPQYSRYIYIYLVGLEINDTFSFFLWLKLTIKGTSVVVKNAHNHHVDIKNRTYSFSS